MTEAQGAGFAVEALVKMCGGPGGAPGETTEVKTCFVVLGVFLLLFCGYLLICFSLSTV